LIRDFWRVFAFAVLAPWAVLLCGVAHAVIAATADRRDMRRLLAMIGS
jgi:hypothetical protein